MPSIRLSLLLPCYNEIAFIEAVLQNALAQDFPADQMEILVLDGGSTDGTREVIQGYAAQEKRIQLVHNPDRFVPQAMNRGIRVAQGEVIMRWDAHAAYPSDYASRLVTYLDENGVANVGGLWQIEPRGQGAKAKAIALVLAHPLGVGNATYRLGATKATEVDTVPFGCFPRSVFEQYGYYDERLHRNQDIELNRRIRRQGGRIVLLPEVILTYYARSTFGGLWKNNFANGEWVIRTAAYTGTLDALSWRHFVPLGFTGGVLGIVLIGLLVWGNVLSQAWLVLAVLPLSYFLLTFGAALRGSWEKRDGRLLLPLTLSFWVLHFSYGWGSLRGIWKVLKNNK